MRNTLFSLALTLSMVIPAVALSAPDVRNGDIIFHQSVSFQSKALEIATRSPYTHCGIVFFKDEKPYVFEAVHTVSWTPLNDWIKRGIEGRYVLMRLKQPLDEKGERSLREAASDFVGKGYDLFFNWSDETIYCSELAWKVYDRALGLSLIPLKTFRDYELDHEEVQRIVKERFKIDIPWDEYAATPADLMESDLLQTIDMQQ